MTVPPVVAKIPVSDLGAAGDSDDLAHYMGRTTSIALAIQYGDAVHFIIEDYYHYYLLSDGVIT